MQLEPSHPEPVTAEPKRHLRVRARWRSLPDSQRKRLGAFLLFCAAVIAFSWKTLFGVVALSLHDTLHSHLPLIPIVSVYLLWIRRTALPQDYRSSPAVGMLAFSCAAIAWAAPLLWPVDASEQLALRTFSFIGFLVGGGFLFFGARWVRAAAFPLAFLLFMIPLPDRMVDLLEHASKLASAEAADLLFSLSGMTYLRDGTAFHLPGITLHVAQECSGIRSSLVLLITGVFAANLLLQTTWRRWVLVLVVIPIGILRNGFRIATLGYLSVTVGPQILDTAIHHRGGPVFFALSMIPFLAIVWWLRKGDGRNAPSSPRTVPRP